MIHNKMRRAGLLYPIERFLVAEVENYLEWREKFSAPCRVQVLEVTSRYSPLLHLWIRSVKRGKILESDTLNAIMSLRIGMAPEIEQNNRAEYRLYSSINLLVDGIIGAYGEIEAFGFSSDYTPAVKCALLSSSIRGQHDQTICRLDKLGLSSNLR